MALFKTVYASSAQELGADGLVPRVASGAAGGRARRAAWRALLRARAAVTRRAGRRGAGARAGRRARIRGSRHARFDRRGADSSCSARPATVARHRRAAAQPVLKLTCYQHARATARRAVRVAVRTTDAAAGAAPHPGDDAPRFRMLYVREHSLPARRRAHRLDEEAEFDRRRRRAGDRRLRRDPSSRCASRSSMLPVHLPGRRARRRAPRQASIGEKARCQLKADQVRASGRHVDDGRQTSRATAPSRARASRRPALTSTSATCCSAPSSRRPSTAPPRRAMSERRAREARLSARSRRAADRFDRGRVRCRDARFGRSSKTYSGSTSRRLALRSSMRRRAHAAPAQQRRGPALEHAMVRATRLSPTVVRRCVRTVSDAVQVAEDDVGEVPIADDDERRRVAAKVRADALEPSRLLLAPPQHRQAERALERVGLR